MNNETISREPRIKDLESQRLIGIGRICATSAECHNVWAGENGFQARAGEIQMCDGAAAYYGICRCAQDAEPGAFEYIAAVTAADDARVPDGMIEVTIPAGTYVEFPVAGMNDIGRTWGYIGEWFAANPEWQGFCEGNPDGCGCIAHPSFELYLPGFDETGGLSICVPIRPSMGK